MDCGLLAEFDTTKVMEEFDWENMLGGVELPEDAFNFIDASPISPPGVGAAGESWICEIEQMLMRDDDDEHGDANRNGELVVDGFNLSDILLDSPESLEKNSTCSSPNSNPNSDSEGNLNVNVDVDVNGVGNLSDENVNCSSPNFDNNGEDVNDSKEDEDDDGGDDVDPQSKKRKRQLRNRDAAMRSRERKKMYVKDLEVKSRYLEAECRRLGRLLQCCYAENQMLRISLQSGSTFAMSKPESAVLLLESLLLGSLVWFVALMCLLPLPSVLALSRSQGPVLTLGSTERNNLGSAAQRRKGTNPSELWLSLLFTRSKRCRASRTKMEHNFTCPRAII